MSDGVVAGVIATGVALVVFLVWSYRELRRVDEHVPRERPQSEGGDGAGSGR